MQNLSKNNSLSPQEGKHNLEQKQSFEEKQTFSGNKALNIEEKLIFEIGNNDKTGVDFEDFEPSNEFLGKLKTKRKLNLPGLSEPETVRHFTRLSQKNYSIDTGIFPLGSCTMKHNPRINEKIARLPGFADIHPLQPISTVQGALQVMHEISVWLLEITGMEKITLNPKAGAHGELCGMMCIKKAIKEKKQKRNIVLVPESAHGTNPSTASLLNFEVRPIVANPKKGIVEVSEVKKMLSDDVAAIMITNPNTCGIFEENIIEITNEVHKAGAFVYCDGANLNAIIGQVKIADLGIDAMHINLHKTFSTPHGGGGPGSGPVVLSDRIARFAPIPYLQKDAMGNFNIVENDSTHNAFGRIAAFHGQMGMFVRALCYMLSHGIDGLKQVSLDAVLNANYLKNRIQDVFGKVFETEHIMHELLLDDRILRENNLTLNDFVKALIDEGFHPMTVFFPLVVQGAMLIETTETESKQSIDEFSDAMIALANQVKKGNKEMFLNAPIFAPRKRLDETRSARKPVLTYQE